VEVEEFVRLPQVDLELAVKVTQVVMQFLVKMAAVVVEQEPLEETPKVEVAVMVVMDHRIQLQVLHSIMLAVVAVEIKIPLIKELVD
jgi:hypothetical protein